MKFLVSVKNVTIELKSQWEEPHIEKVLEMLGYILNGVDCAGDWEEFMGLLKTDAEALRELVIKRMEKARLHARRDGRHT